MYVSKTTKKNPLAIAAASFAVYAGALCASLSLSSTALAWNVSPGGTVSFAAPVTLSTTAPPYATTGVNCTLSMQGSFAPSTGELTITSAALNSNCQYANGSATEGIRVDANQFPIGPMPLEWDGSANTLSLNFVFGFVFWQKLGFGPAPAASTCTFNANLIWNNTQNISSSPPSNQAQISGGYGTATNGHGPTYDCSISGTFTITPSQSIIY